MMKFLEKLLSMMIAVLAVIVICGVFLQNNQIAGRVGQSISQLASEAGEALSFAESQVSSRVAQAKNQEADKNPAIPVTKDITAAPSSAKLEVETKVAAPVAAADLKSFWGETGMKGLTVYEYGKTLLNNAEKTCYCSIATAVKNLLLGVTINTTLPPSQIKKVYKYYINDHAEVFYISGVNLLYSDSGGYFRYKLTFEYKYGGNKSKIVSMRSQLRKKALEVLTAANGLSTDLKKERALHDKFIRLCSYDIKAAQNADEYPDSYSAYGALVSNKAVCQGYAQAMKLLLSSAGIKSLYITGQANGGSHSWNIVEIGGKWYYFDATFDDPVYIDISGNYTNYNTISYTYFNYTSISDHKVGIFDSKNPFSQSSENYAIMPRIS